MFRNRVKNVQMHKHMYKSPSPQPSSPMNNKSDTKNDEIVSSSSRALVPITQHNSNNNKSLSYSRSRFDFIYSLDQNEKSKSLNNHHSSSSSKRSSDHQQQQLVSFDPKIGSQVVTSASLTQKSLTARSQAKSRHDDDQQSSNNMNNNHNHITRQAVLSISEGDKSFLHRSRGTILPPLALELSSFVRRENQRIEKDSQALASYLMRSNSNTINNNIQNMITNSPTSRSIKTSSTTATSTANPRIMKERLTTVRETLNCLANHFSDYNEVFGQILVTLDQSLIDATETQKKFSELELFRNSSDSIVEQKIHEVKDTFQRQFEVMRERQEQDQIKMGNLMAEVEKAVGDCNFHKRRLTEKQREFEESQTRAQMFQFALEEETKRSIELTKRLSRLTATNKQLTSNVDFMDRLLKDAESQIEKARQEQKRVTDAVKNGSTMNRNNEEPTTTKNDGNDENDDNGGQKHEHHNNHDDDDDENENDEDDNPDDPVPRRMDEAVLDKLTHWKEKLFHLDVKVKRLAAINNELMEDKMKLQDRIDTLKDAMVNKNEALTPRPNWLRVNEVLPRFSLNTVASSDETLDDVLLLCQQELNSVRHEAEARIMGTVVHDFLGEENLCESDLIRSTKHFIARGTGPHVPVYLRATGIIKNRRMRKFGAEAVLKKFWSARRKQLEIPAPSVSKLLTAGIENDLNKNKNGNNNNTQPDELLPIANPKLNKKKHLHLLHTNIYQHVQEILHPHASDRKTNERTGIDLGAYYSGGKVNKYPIDFFFIEFLTELTGTTKLAVELAYNLLSICEQFPSDADCNAILRVLRGEISEFIIYDQMDMLVKLEAALHSVDISKKGKLSRSTIHRVLHLMFPAKSKEDMLRLRLNLAISCGGNQMVDIAALFREDDEANQSRFVETLRSQHLEEVLLFGVEIEETLRETTRMSVMMMSNDRVDPTVSSSSSSSSDFIDAALAKAALHAIDPSMPEHIVSEIIAAGCGLKSGKDLDEMLVSRSDGTIVMMVVNNNNNNNNNLQTSSDGKMIQGTATSTSSLRYPVEPFLDRIRRNVLVRRYGKRPGQEDTLLGGVLASDHGTGGVLTKSEANALKADEDDDERFFKFMYNINDDDDDEDNEEKQQQEKSPKQKQQQASNHHSSGPPNRKMSLTSFVRTNFIAGDANSSISNARRKSVYAENEIDKLLEDESDLENQENENSKNSNKNDDDRKEKRDQKKTDEKNDDLEDEDENEKPMKKKPSFASILQRANSKSSLTREDFQRKVDLGESLNRSNNNPSVNKNHSSSALPSMSNAVTAAVAAENFRRMFQQSQAEKEAMRRSVNNESEKRKTTVSIL